MERPPTPPQSGTLPTDPLPAGVEVTLSDAILVFRPDAPPHERESARQFPQMLGVAYKMLNLPPVEYRYWVDRAERTLRDLVGGDIIRAHETSDDRIDYSVPANGRLVLSWE